MKKILINSTLFLITAFIVLCAPGCGGGGSGVSSDVESAMDDAANGAETIYFSLSAGSIEGLRSTISSAFPQVDTLIGGGSSARDAMLQDFTGTPSFSDDVKLAIFAYALELMGDSNSVTTLRTFLENNITGDLYLTPQFVAHAIIALSNGSNGDALFYSPTEMRFYAGIAQTIGSPERETSSTRLSCARQYELLDENGDVLTYVDENGDPQDAVITGYVYTTSALSDEESERLQNEVTSGGGTYVNDNSEFRGSPSGQFNCGGYAFRGLNGDRRWRLDPAKTFDVLTRTGTLIEVPESEARVGDKVFYFKYEGSTRPGHVAEVESVQSGVISNTIIVRNADNNTGLWEAPIDASYFMGSWMPNSDAPRYAFRKVYRWASGSEPTLQTDSSATSSDYCDSSSLGFSATVDITGYSVTFTPTTVLGANNGTYSGGVTLDDVVGIAAIEGSGGDAAVASLNFDRRQITSGGTYSLNTIDNVFDAYTGAGTLAFASPSITNEDDGSNVAFASTSGSFTLTSWGASFGDQLIGTYLANVEGEHTYLDAWGNPVAETLTGMISGSFNVEITEGN